MAVCESPESARQVDVTFRPVSVDGDIRIERVRCSVDGGDPLFLTLTGACAATQPQPEPVRFQCKVRLLDLCGVRGFNRALAAALLSVAIQRYKQLQR